MNNLTPAATLPSKIVVRAINFELEEPLQTATTEKAARLLRHHDQIVQIVLELENDSTRDQDQQYVAKGKVDFGGPALLASVMGRDATQTLDYLIENLDHQLRRQRRSMAMAARSGPAS